MAAIPPRLKKLFWPAVGFAAVAFSVWLLIGELRNTSLDDIWDSLIAIRTKDWILAICSTLAAYAALAGYDHIALLHLHKKIPWVFVTLCSFTTYALAHNIGGSVFSGAVVRYRAYSTQGLSAPEVGILVGLCSLTFVLASILLTGLALVLHPHLLDRFADLPHLAISKGVGYILLLLVAAYVIASLLKLPPLVVGRFKLEYPSPAIVARQLIIGPMELLAAAAIIYFAMPTHPDVTYFTVLGVFLISFSAALISHAPGGLGVLEVMFLAGFSEIDPAAVMAALLVFRLLYLIIPLIIGLFVVVLFERSQYPRDEQSMPDP